MDQVTVYAGRKQNRLSAGAVTETQLFHTCCWLYLVAFFILPDGFGFRLGFLWSAKRIMLFICYAMILFNRERLTTFWNDIRKCVVPNIFISLYMFVRIYTAVYRTDVNSFSNDLIDAVLVFYLFYFILKNKLISIGEFLRFIRITLIILCVEALWEAITGINLFGFLNIAGEDVWTSYASRGGGSRVSGNCHHSIHFGIYLSILFFLSCVDEKKNKLYLFRNPGLLVLASICIFLTGSRAPLGIYILCVFLICLFSNKDERIKSFIALLFILSVFSLFTMVVYRTEIGRQIMYMLTAMWDAVFGTEYALNFSDTVLRYSTEYRDALAKVFQLDYFNKIMGRGASYQLSVVIDGYWLRSCDNSYVGTYISFAYPGLAMLIGHGLLIVGFCLRGLWKKRQMLFAATLVAILCYFLNIWFVAQMGTYMYIWMLFALIYVCFQTNPQNKMKEDLI